MRSFGADVVIVCEAWRTLDGQGVLDELAQDGYRVELVRFATFERGVWDPEPAMPGEGHWELALCSRLPISARWEIPVSHVGRDKAFSRVALACTVDVGGNEIDVVGLHVSSKLWKLAPLRQLNSLRSRVPPSDRAAVLAGDCNFWGPGVVSVLRGWHRAVRGRTYPAPRPHSQIDHVLVRDGVTVVSSEVLPATLSDHRPVRARLRVPAR